MADTPELLPDSRAYFRKFLAENKRSYFDGMRYYKVGGNSGYGYFYRSDEVIQLMRDMYHNLEETFGNLTIPEEFPSPKRLCKTWLWFYDYLSSKEALFKEIRNYLMTHFEIPRGFTREEYIAMGISLPEPFTGIDKLRIELIDALEHILSLKEVQAYLKDTKQNEEPINLDADDIFIPNYSSNSLFDIAIITAINSPELKRVKEIIEGISRFPVQNDPTIYHNGYFTRINGDKIKVIAGSDDKMGMPAASSLAMKMIFTFRPKYLVMLGICAGIKDKMKIGDIIVAELTWDYGSGKNELIKTATGDSKIFKPYINQIPLDVHLEGLLKSIAADGKYVEVINGNWNKKNKAVNSSLIAKVGPFASGSAVIANEEIVKEINSGHGKLLGFDMESYGIFHAARYSPIGNTKAIVMKSVSDFGDSDKGNPDKEIHQDYAAFTSAQYFHQVAINDLSY